MRAPEFTPVVTATSPPTAGRGRSGLARLLVIPAAFAAIIAIVPLVYLAVRSTEQGIGAFWAEVSRPQTLELLTRSVLISVVVTIVCTLLALGLAWAVTMTNLPGRAVWQATLALPLAVPTYVAAYTWLGNVSNLPPFFGATGVLIACSYPYAYLPILAAMRRLDPQLSEVARSLGLSQREVFWRITAPQIRPAATSGALLVGLYVMSDFGAVSLMRYDTLTRGIYLSYVGSFDRTPAAILGVLLVLMTLVIVLLEMRSRGAVDRSVASARGARRAPIPARLGWKKVPLLFGLSLVVAISLGIPVVSLLRWFAKSDSFEGGELLAAARNSLTVSALGALVCTVLAVPIALLAARSRSRSTRIFEGATYIGHALPGLVIALSMVFLGVKVLTPIYQRTPLLLLAYVALFLPLAVAAARTSFGQAPPLLDDVARSLGQSPLSVLRRVTLPIAAPGIGAGSALVALTCIKELPATLLLRPTSMNTLATRIWTETEVADYGRAAPYAVVMLIMGALPMMILSRTSHR